MTRLISDSDLRGAKIQALQPQQQHMIIHITTDVNADVENGLLTPTQAAEALERLAQIIRKKVKP